MSLRQVLTIYNAERQLSDDETALLNTLRKMTDAERGMFVDGLSDKPQKKSSERTIEHCAACDYTRRAQVHKDAFVTGYHEFQSSAKSSKKSAGGGGRRQSRREVSLRQQIGSVVQGSGNNLDGGVSKMRCAMGNCGEYADSNVHHLTTDPDFHEFQPAEQAAASGGAG